jgi:hypothetical protein
VGTDHCIDCWGEETAGCFEDMYFSDQSVSGVVDRKRQKQQEYHAGYIPCHLTLIFLVL